MTERIVSKNLAGFEDFLWGVGTEQQTRAGGQYPVTKLSLPWVVAAAEDLADIDTTKFTVAMVAGLAYTFVDPDWVVVPVAAHTHAIADVTGLNDALTAKLSKSGDTLVNVVETVFTPASSTIDAAEGLIATFTVTANTTITVDNLSSGQALTLHLTDGNSFIVAWQAGLKWVGGSAPTLTPHDVIQYWSVGSTVYAAYVGSVV